MGNGNSSVPGIDLSGATGVAKTMQETQAYSGFMTALSMQNSAISAGQSTLREAGRNMKS